MRIELDKLENGGSRFAHVFEVGELSLDDDRARLAGPAEVRGSLERVDGLVRLQGTVSGKVELECDRCLQPVILPLAVSFDVEYVPAGNYETEQQAELQDKDLVQSLFDGESIDVADLVREQVILSLPARALCREECKGLCPVCGIDKNLKDCECDSRPRDQRWAALDDLRF
ncbi:MAG: DUF177 domain-containing protein [Pyrinomonadaceae bacterium]